MGLGFCLGGFALREVVLVVCCTGEKGEWVISIGIFGGDPN